MSNSDPKSISSIAISTDATNSEEYIHLCADSLDLFAADGPGATDMNLKLIKIDTVYTYSEVMDFSFVPDGVGRQPKCLESRLDNTLGIDPLGTAHLSIH